MSTLSEIVYNIQNFIEGGRIQVDSIPSYEQIVFNVNIQRAKWARRDINKNGYISDTWQQDLGCVELELVDSAQCCTIESGCDILRTVNKLPRLVRLYNRDAITFVGSIDKQSSYAVINPNSAKYAEYEKYTGSQKRFFLLNQYGFLTNSKTQKYINVRGVAGDKIIFETFNFSGGTLSTDTFIEFQDWSMERLNASSKLLGISLENISIPSEIRNKFVRFELGFAERTVENSTILASAPVQGTSKLRSHPIFLTTPNVIFLV